MAALHLGIIWPAVSIAGHMSQYTRRASKVICGMLGADKHLQWKLELLGIGALSGLRRH